jgi:hypothetical protein
MKTTPGGARKQTRPLLAPRGLNCAQLRPELVALVRQLGRRRPKGRRDISAELAQRGHLNERGQPFSAASINSISRHRPGRARITREILGHKGEQRSQSPSEPFCQGCEAGLQGTFLVQGEESLPLAHASAAKISHCCSVTDIESGRSDGRRLEER